MTTPAADGANVATALATAPVAALAVRPEPGRDDASGARDLLELFLAGRAARTLDAYREDLRDLARHLGLQVDETIARLIGGGAGAAHRLALAYRGALLERKLAPATVNRRLASLRSLVRMARITGLVDWELELPGVRQKTLRDTAGPGKAGFQRLLRAAAAQEPGKAARDVAILRLLHDVALRRAELIGLDVDDVELEGAPACAWVVGKGSLERTRVNLPGPTVAAVAAWLAVRGEEAGPFFRNLDRAAKGDGRLSGSGVYKLLRSLGATAGVGRGARPHGLRHTAITTALERAGELGIPIEEVLSFSRHAPGSIGLLLVYRDNLKNRQGELANLVAGV